MVYIVESFQFSSVNLFKVIFHKLKTEKHVFIYDKMQTKVIILILLISLNIVQCT